ncbi:MAG: serpin family protein [Clostridia bacterium]|nr:serpin family protein [Clostridia bacterium]
MNSFFKAAISMILLAAIALSCGCGAVITPAEPTAEPTEKPVSGDLKTVDLMSGVRSSNNSRPVIPAASSADKAADFAVRLFKACLDEKGNTLVSPLSVLAALSMTANGAKGETLAQMEEVLGMPLEELNEFYFNYSGQLENTDKCSMELANSIWFADDGRFEVNGGFLQKNADFFGADIYKAPFVEATRKDINDWVNEHTEGMIPEILGPDTDMSSAVMYLINALAFDAEWERIYETNDVNEGEFTAENGQKSKAEFMYNMERDWLKTDNAEGFIKYYKGGRYAFAALLPNEGVSVNELVASLDGGKLMSILRNRRDEGVMTAIPKFETSFDTELSEVLIGMGMPDAFDAKLADFTGLGTSAFGNIYINRVLHKTFISVDEKGTKAGAATAVEMMLEGAPWSEHRVFLDRPFVYMLIDTKTNLPFFIGTMTDVG